MLLRRITKHVTDQNWFAVFIDFIIVVVGVFIGIQVANWNEERADRVLENQFLERLYEDAEQSNQLAGNLIGRQSSRFASMGSALAKLETDTPQALSNDECNALAGSAIISSALPTLPSVDELRATNGLGLIQDVDILSLLSSIYQTIDLINDLVEKRAPYIIDPTQAYSEYIKLSHYYDDNGEVRVRSTCDYLRMNSDQGFINAMTVNLDFQDLLTRRVLRVQTSFEELRDHLNQLAGTNIKERKQ